MSHRPKNWTKALLAGLLAACTSLVLASPALANSVNAGSLTFSSDSSLAGSDPTAVDFNDTDGTVTVGTSDKSTATINVTQSVLAEGDQEVTSITLASGFNGVINFNNIKLDSVHIIINGTGQGAQVNFTNCTLTGPTAANVNSVHTADAISIGLDTSGGVNSYTATAANNNEVNFLGGNVITGGPQAAGSGASKVAGSALCLLASGPENVNYVTFTGSNTFAGAVGTGDPNTGCDGISVSAAGTMNLTFNGMTTITGGTGTNRGAMCIASGTGTVNMEANAPVNITSTTAHGFDLAGGTLNITGEAPITAVGANLIPSGIGYVGFYVKGGDLNLGTEDGDEGILIGRSGDGNVAASGADSAGVSITSGSLVVNAGSLTAIGGENIGNGNGRAGLNCNVTGGLVVNGGTVEAVGGKATNEAASQGIGIVASQQGAIAVSNGTGVSGKGPSITAVGAPAMTSTTISTPPAADITNQISIDPGTSSTSNDFYPWLVQASTSDDGENPVLVDYAQSTNTATPSIAAVTNEYQWVNIAPHPLTGVSVGLQQIRNAGVTTAKSASFVQPVETDPRLPQEAATQYEIVAVPAFASVEGLNVSASPITTNVTLSDNSIAPASNVAWINQTNGTFYVPADAQGNALTVSGDVALQAGSPLLRLYPDLAATGQGEVDVPIVYTVTLVAGKTAAGAAQGTFGTASASLGNGPLTYYTAADGTGRLLSLDAVAGDVVSATTPVLKSLPTFTASPATNDFIGYFDETGESPVQVPVSTVIFDTTTTLTAETGKVELASIQPSPVELAQGSATTTTATITVDPVNEDITSYAFDEGGADVTWTVTYTMPDGSAASGQSNGVTVASTENVTTGENPFTVKSYVTLQANGTATIGSFRATPELAGSEIDQAAGQLNKYAVVQVVEGSGGPQTGTTVYRLYNPDNGAHLITADLNEWRTLSSGVGGWEDEGIAFIAAESGVPVYRLLNPNNGDHLYTTSANEYDTLEGDGWVKEGVAFYGAASSPYPIYRLWNRYQTASEGLGSHLWTADHNEYVELNRIDPNGWKQEGEAWFAAALEPGENA